jgi:hypothetical protein
MNGKWVLTDNGDGTESWTWIEDDQALPTGGGNDYGKYDTSGWTTDERGIPYKIDSSGNLEFKDDKGTIFKYDTNKGGFVDEKGNFAGGGNSSLINGIKNFFTKTDGSLDLSKIGLIGGGIAGSLGANTATTKPTGYQGGIPDLVASQPMLTEPPPGRRPGSGGINYGTGVQYKDSKGNIVSDTSTPIADLYKKATQEGTFNEWGHQYGKGLTGAAKNSDDVTRMTALLRKKIADQAAATSNGISTVAPAITNSGTANAANLAAAAAGTLPAGVGVNSYGQTGTPGSIVPSAGGFAGIQNTVQDPVAYAKMVADKKAQDAAEQAKLDAFHIDPSSRFYKYQLDPSSIPHQYGETDAQALARIKPLAMEEAQTAAYRSTLANVSPGGGFVVSNGYIGRDPRPDETNTVVQDANGQSRYMTIKERDAQNNAQQQYLMDRGNIIDPNKPFNVASTDAGIQGVQAALANLSQTPGDDKTRQAALKNFLETTTYTPEQLSAASNGQWAVKDLSSQMAGNSNLLEQNGPSGGEIRSSPGNEIQDMGMPAQADLIAAHDAEVAKSMANSPFRTGGKAGGMIGNSSIKLAQGGLTNLDHGGFVIPADVVSHFGNGSSSAGLELLAQKMGATPIKGDGDGMSDSIPAAIDGREKALVANDEAYLSPQMVERLGDGDMDAGSRKLKNMMEQIRRARTGSKEQGKQIDPNKFMPGGTVGYAQGGGIKSYAGTDPTGSLVTAGVTGTEQNLSNYIGPYASTMLGKTQALANTPYQAYTGPLTAGASDLQNQAFNTAANLPTNGGMATGFAQQAGNLSYTPTTTGFDATQAQQYMNPYLQASLDPQLAEARRQSEITQQQNNAAMTKAGAFGGGRQAILTSENQRNLGTNQANITGAGYNTAYNNAMAQFNADQNRQMAENQFGANYGLQGLQTGISGANTANQIGINNLNTQANLGTTQRGIESEGLAADKAQFEEARKDPYTKLQFQQSMLNGLPITATNYNLSTPSAFQSAAGGATTIAQFIKNFFPDYKG